MSEELTFREKFRALSQVAAFRPATTVGLIALSLVAAVLEGIGLSFIIPIVKQVNGPGASDRESGLISVFLDVYEFLGIPFTLESVVIGVILVMGTRYGTSFFVEWLQGTIRTVYVRHLQSEAFSKALDANVAYFDEQGSDEILNAIVTQAAIAGEVIQRLVRVIEHGLMTIVYLAITLSLAPKLTIFAGVFLGGIIYGFRYLVESAYTLGDRVADANERVQTVVQAGMQGIRDVKVFGLETELYEEFDDEISEYAESHIAFRRNKAAMHNFYQMTTAVSVFSLIYFAIEFTSLSIGGLGIFLFAMFRLSPKVSTLNNLAYQLEGDLPHLYRTQQFIKTLDSKAEPRTNNRAPESVDRVSFDEVKFSYSGEMPVLRNVSFSVNRGEFIAFVGSSGAGKSTIVSLLARMYEPDSGQITANGTDIRSFDVQSWRSKVSVVRQDPFIFNKTLRYNLTLGNREATDEEIKRAAELAQVTEFLDDLPNGYETVLGDNGVRVSGGQRQRIAIARALLVGSDILVLDEATSDLDTALEQRVHDGITDADEDIALVVVAHRLSTVTGADRIYTMNDGNVVEMGSHEQLVSQNGEYARLYSNQ
ncbi:ABC transporter ATP-binding protein [Haloarcula sp. JP-L23]|uniref:ABC transporter ATP-binding protein n=1 Tax=Haloarcula sp. JP-L23 TaxID=2716717 RepID=UPI00140EB95E|nr:ABC transporter ATP-binding protein [Haloarcula sp. JP-L23]